MIVVSFSSQDKLVSLIGSSAELVLVRIEPGTLRFRILTNECKYNIIMNVSYPKNKEQIVYIATVVKKPFLNEIHRN